MYGTYMECTILVSQWMDTDGSFNPNDGGGPHPEKPATLETSEPNEGLKLELSQHQHQHQHQQ